MSIIIKSQKNADKNDNNKNNGNTKFNVDDATSACIDLLEKAKNQLLQYNETIKQYNECVIQILTELEKNGEIEQLEQTNNILNPYIKPLNVESIMEPLPDNMELVSYKDLDDTHSLMTTSVYDNPSINSSVNSSGYICTESQETKRNENKMNINEDNDYVSDDIDDMCIEKHTGDKLYIENYTDDKPKTTRGKKKNKNGTPYNSKRVRQVTERAVKKKY